MVAWCSKAGHGTRVIPAGALTAVQFIQTPAYVQVTGLFNQQLLDMDPTDGGGEMDPHGADGRGNPIGGVVFSDAFPASGGNNNTYIQAVEWHNFMGSGVFCFKACDPAGPNAADFCQHVFDRIGCQYNAPAAYTPNLFESCLGDNQDYPGVYTGADGVVTTYVQPPESLGAISSIPYTARIPASSSCTTYQSTALYSSNPSATIGGSSSGAAATMTKAAAATGGAKASTASASTASGTAKSGAQGLKAGGAVVAFVVAFVGAIAML